MCSRGNPSHLGELLVSCVCTTRSVFSGAAWRQAPTLKTRNCRSLTGRYTCRYSTAVQLMQKSAEVQLNQEQHHEEATSNPLTGLHLLRHIHGYSQHCLECVIGLQKQTLKMLETSGIYSGSCRGSRYNLIWGCCSHFRLSALAQRRSFEVALSHLLHIPGTAQ